MISPALSVAYLVQGSAANLSRLHFPAGRVVVLLAYDHAIDIAGATCLFDAAASWAEGRNALVVALQAQGRLPDYIILCDDDIAFETGDFERFEARLAETRPFLGVPLMEKAWESATYRADLPTQRILALDEQIVALHRDAIGIEGIVPLLARYDCVSWYVASLVFEYLCLIDYAPFCHQYNDIKVRNENHIWEVGGTLYHRGDIDTFVELWQGIMMVRRGSFNPVIVEQFDRDKLQHHEQLVADVATIRPWSAKRRKPEPAREAIYDVQRLVRAHFDEEAYLATYDDIAIAVDAGLLANGAEHWYREGHQEGRAAFRTE